MPYPKWLLWPLLKLLDTAIECCSFLSVFCCVIFLWYYSDSCSGLCSLFHWFCNFETRGSTSSSIVFLTDNNLQWISRVLWNLNRTYSVFYVSKSVWIFSYGSVLYPEGFTIKVESSNFIYSGPLADRHYERRQVES